VFRQIKQMKAMLEDAPGMMQQAQLMDAQSRQLALAREAVRQVRQAQADGMQAGYIKAGCAQVSPNFEPIAGVGLEEYAAICKSAAAFGHDPSRMAEVAAARGISPVAWQAAVTGWNARLRAHAAVARRFNLRYRES